MLCPIFDESRTVKILNQFHQKTTAFLIWKGHSVPPTGDKILHYDSIRNILAITLKIATRMSVVIDGGGKSHLATAAEHM